jgi:hypothetical protein
MSKGSNRRPLLVPLSTFDQRWERAFGRGRRKAATTTSRTLDSERGDSLESSPKTSQQEQDEA